MNEIAFFINNNDIFLGSYENDSVILKSNSNNSFNLLPYVNKKARGDI